MLGCVGYVTTYTYAAVCDCAPCLGSSVGNDRKAETVTGGSYDECVSTLRTAGWEVPPADRDPAGVKVRCPTCSKEAPNV